MRRFCSHSLSRPNLVWGCCEFIVNEHKREIAKSKVVCCFKKMSVFASFYAIFPADYTFVSVAMFQFINSSGKEMRINVKDTRSSLKNAALAPVAGSLLDLTRRSTYNRGIVVIRSGSVKAGKAASATSTPCD